MNKLLTHTSERGDHTAASFVPTLVVIDRKVMQRDCLSLCLSVTGEWRVLTYDCAESWLLDQSTASLVIVCAHNQASISNLKLGQLGNSAPIALIAESENPTHIVSALTANVRGYIPTSSSLQMAMTAM